MARQLPNNSIAQFIARGIGFALVCIHGLIALAIASNFGGKGMEWWPLIFLPLDFPVSALVILIEKQWELFSEWGIWFAFLVSGSIWHFYWPQGLTWAIRFIISRLRHR